jgi:cobalt-precorrin 5A hydrolase
LSALGGCLRIAIIAITRNGAQQGARLRSGLGNGDLYVLRRYLGQGGKGAIAVDGELRQLLQDIWPQYDGFVCIMAAGIVVRLVAPLLAGKDKDPAVVVMDDVGRFAISLLSGHIGGANELARRCAFITGAREVITTATDANDLPSFDMLAKENGWAIEELSRVKTLNRLLLDNEEIAVVDTTGRVRPWFHGRGRLVFHDTVVGARRSGARGFLLVSNAFIPQQLQSEGLLVLRPRNLVLGIGCNSGTSAEELRGVVMAQLKRLLLSPLSVVCIATAEAKAEEPGLVALARELGIPLCCFSSGELNAVEAPSPPSPHAQAAIGAQGVAEPAAILASHGGRLLLQKVKDGNVTLAIAETE